MGDCADDIIEGRCNPDGTWTDAYINGFDSDAEYYQHLRQESKEKKKQNVDWSMGFLEEKGIAFTVVNRANWHLRYLHFDFYPTTGLFINLQTKKKGRGVKNFYNIIKNL